MSIQLATAFTCCNKANDMLSAPIVTIDNFIVWAFSLTDLKLKNCENGCMHKQVLMF